MTLPWGIPSVYIQNMLYTEHENRVIAFDTAIRHGVPSKRLR